jgi:hypothetical protein
MNAAELIAELAKVPPDTRVTVNCMCEECGMRDQTVERVEFYPDYQPKGTHFPPPVIQGFVEVCT